MYENGPNSLKVLLVVPTYSESGNKLLQGISNYADKHGLWIFHRADPSSFYKKRKIKRSSSLSSIFPKWLPDGIITSNPEITRKFSENGTPTVVFQNYSDGYYEKTIPRICLDNHAIGQMAAKEFLDRGYKNFAYWGGGNGVDISHARIQAFRNMIILEGYDLLVYNGNKKYKNSWEKEQTYTAQWLMSLPKPVGIFVYDDNSGRDLIEVAKTANIKIPEDVAIMGVGNDILICNFCTPPLSSIVLDNETGGYEAAGLLHQLMVNSSTQKHSVVIKPLTVCTRQSTDIMAVHDEDVNSALCFIHRNCQKNIYVQDVVDAVAISRRRLQEKFCRVLGRTISDEIARVRTEQISRMLLNTDLTVQQIALKFGYNGLSHISRFFKRQVGFSPVEYRKRYGRF